MKLSKTIWLPLALAIGCAQNGTAAPLANADISAGDCERNCLAWVLLSDDAFFVWKGEQHPQLVLSLGPADGENVKKMRAKMGFTLVRGELHTGDCLANCEAAAVAANLELTVRRDGEGQIQAVWARSVGDGRGYRAPKPPPSGALSGQDTATLAISAVDPAICTGGGGTGLGDVECRATVVHEVLRYRCTAQEVNWIGVKETVDCQGNILDAQAFQYRLPNLLEGRLC